VTSANSRCTRRIAAIAAAGLALAVGLAVPASAINPSTGIATVSAVPNNLTPSFNTTCTSAGVTQNCAQVRAQAQNGNTMYAGGSWAQVTDPTTKTTTTSRPNLVAYNRTTGAIMSGFAAHTFDGMVLALALSPDGTKLYVGGEFSKICTTTNGTQTCATVQHLAAFNSTTGALLSAFQVSGKATSNPAATNPAAAYGRVRALFVYKPSNTLYVAGDFTKLEGASVTQLAALNVSTGALITAFKPVIATNTAAANNVPPSVNSVAVGPGTTAGSTRVYAGGHFDYINGKAQTTLTALHPSTGVPDTTFVPALQFQTSPYDPNEAGLGIAIAPDGTVLMAQGGHYNRGYRFNLSGTRVWMVNSGGDLQTVALSGNAVYFGGHFICWSNGTPIDRSTCTTPPVPSYTVIRNHLAVVSFAKSKAGASDNGGALDSNWAPMANPTYTPYYYGVWTLLVSTTGDVYAGGVFTTIQTNGVNYAHPKLAVFPDL
jgi:hypothetical protein